jgi:hypothetical protein
VNDVLLEGIAFLHEPIGEAARACRPVDARNERAALVVQRSAIWRRPRGTPTSNVEL